MKTKSPITLRLIIAVQILIACLAWASSAFARIGETEAQIAKRYGPSKFTIDTPSGKRSRFLFAGYFIFVDYESGISACETYTKKDASVIQPDEVVTLLAANSGGAEWSEPELSGDQYISHTKKGPKRVALYNPISRDLMITSREFLNRAAGQINAAQREKMKGF